MWKLWTTQFGLFGVPRRPSLLLTKRKDFRGVVEIFSSDAVKSKHGKALLPENPETAASVPHYSLHHSSKEPKTKREKLQIQLDAAKIVIRGRVDDIRRENVWTIPNILCLSRIAVCPYLGYAILSGQYTTALGIFVVAGVSDGCDGLIARTYKSQATILGTLLDPLADKLLIGTIFLTMTFAGLVPATLTCIVLGRDCLLTSAGIYLRFASLPKPRSLADFFDPSLPSVRVQPSGISKFNTLVQVTAAAVSLALPAFSVSSDWSPLLVTLWYATGVTTIVSFVSYLMTSSSAYKVLRQSRNKPP